MRDTPVKFDPARCKAMVYHAGAWREFQCEKKATRDGYCGIHHPDAKAARKAKSDAKWKERQEIPRRPVNAEGGTGGER